MKKKRKQSNQKNHMKNQRKKPKKKKKKIKKILIHQMKMIMSLQDSILKVIKKIKNLNKPININQI